MKTIKKKLLAKDEYDFTLKHLSIVNQLIPSQAQLSHKELEVLAAFMHYKGEMVEDDRFNTHVRSLVMKKLNMSSGGLSNHIRSMLDKGILEKNEFSGKIKIKPFLFPENKVQEYQIILGNESRGV